MASITMPAPADVHDDAACEGCDHCTALCQGCDYCLDTTRAQFEAGDWDPGMCDCHPAECPAAPYDSYQDW